MFFKKNKKVYYIYFWLKNFRITSFQKKTRHSLSKKILKYKPNK